MRRLLLIWTLLTAAVAYAQQPIFVNEGETVVYHISRDESAQRGTVSDALQNVPGVKVDTEGNISLRGVSSVELFINGKPSHFDSESLKNYLQQVKASSIERIEVMTNPSVQYTSESGTGVINLVTGGTQREQHLSAGLQVNSHPEVAPWISYLWNNEKWSFTANLKGTTSYDKSLTQGYSYSFTDHLDNGVVQGIDTTTHIRYQSHDTTRSYNAEIFLKAEFRPNPSNDFMAFFNITPSNSNSSSLSETYRHEYINDAGFYEYSVFNESHQTTTFGSMGISWQHRFQKPQHNMGFQLNSNYDFGKPWVQEIRTFKDQSQLNRDIITVNEFVDFGYDAKLEHNYPYSKYGEVYLSVTDRFLPDNNICTYDTLGADGYVTDWRRSENRELNKRQTAGIVMLQHHFGRLTVKPGISWEHTRVKATYHDTPEYDTLMHFAYWRPSLHLSYRTPSMHNFSFSYTRKTDYPWVRYFTRRAVYSEESFSIGNPLLKPTLIDVFELSWAKYYDQLGSVNVKGYYNNSINAINSVSDVIYDELWGRVVQFSKPVNLNHYYEAGAEFNLTYRPNATVNVRLDANVYQSHIETYYDKTQDSLICSNMLSYNLRLSSWAKLWNKLEMHATAY